MVSELFDGIASGGKGAVAGVGPSARARVLTQALTKGRRVQVPSEARLEFSLTGPARVTLLPKAE